ncbi:MAG: hypothetical protein MJ083_03995 [Clostridia bacterium]|nr:hypothetical protein [Clostridia bacterium]
MFESLKEKNVFAKYEKPLWKIYQIAYFVALVLSVTVRYYDSTMFGNTIPAIHSLYEIIYFVSNLIIPFLVIFNLVCAVLSAFHLTAPQFTWTLSEFLVGASCCLLLYLPYRFWGYDQLLWIAVFVFCAHKIDFRKILKIFLVLSVILFVAVFICGCTGIIPDLVYFRGDGTSRHSFGFNYVTWPPTHLLFISIFWIWLRKENVTYCEIGVFAVFAVFSYLACHARTVFLCFALLIVWLFIVKIRTRKPENAKYIMSKPLQTCCLLSYPISALIMTLLSLFFNPNSSAFRFLDRLTSNRLTLGNIGFARYPITLFGQEIPMVSLCGTTKPPLEEYFFLDCTYLYVLLRYGALAFCALMFIWVYSCFREQQKKNYIRLGLLAVIALKCIMEYHPVDQEVFLLYLLALDPDDGEGFNLRAAFPKRKKAGENPPETT